MKSTVIFAMLVQIIPAENIVAAIQGTRKTVFAISKTSSEAQLFFEVVSFIDKIRK